MTNSMTDQQRLDLMDYAMREATHATAELHAARERLSAAKTKKAQRAAYADIEFWGNKLDFLTHARI